MIFRAVSRGNVLIVMEINRLNCVPEHGCLTILVLGEGGGVDMK